MSNSYGMRAYNSAGQVLISSDLSNLHFAGRAEFQEIVSQHDQYGGCTLFRYTIALTTVPVPFVHPNSDSAFFSVVSVDQSTTGLWEIDVARSGAGGSAPDLFVFTIPEGFGERSENYGMLVFRDDGEAAFDSRIQPLAVTGGGECQPPNSPISSSNQLTPTEYNSYDLGSLNWQDLMFCSPSLAQAEREYSESQYHEECIGFSFFGWCFGWSSEWSRTDTWWGFYRSAFRIRAGVLECGWLTYSYGHHWRTESDESFLFFDVGGGSSSGGTWPYSNKSINLSANSYLLAHPSRYRS